MIYPSWGSPPKIYAWGINPSMITMIVSIILYKKYIHNATLIIRQYLAL